MQLKQKVTMTGYRILFILQLLMQGPVSKEEIISRIKRHKSLQDVRPDTIRLDINTLKAAGFDIDHGDKGNGYRYCLNWNTIKIPFTQAEINAIGQLKRAVIEICDWKYIVSLYEVLQKIANYIDDQELAQELLNFHYFNEVDFNILKELHYHCVRKNEIVMLYNSTRSGLKQWRVRCIQITHDKNTNKLHFWCKSPKFNDFSFLRIDRVEKIIMVRTNSKIELGSCQKCRFRVHKEALAHFAPEENEILIESNPEYSEYEATIMSRFHFIQRVLSLGGGCFWVSDDSIRREILETLHEVKRKYSEHI